MADFYGEIMTFLQDPSSDEWPNYEGPDDEPPYPEGISMAPLVVSVAIILTLMCWWLAYNAPDLPRALLFGIAPFFIWCVGLRIVRKSKKQAEAEDRTRLFQVLYHPLEDVPEHIYRYILETEEVLYFSRKHPVTLLGRKRPWLGGLVSLLLVALAVGALHFGAPLVSAGLLGLVLVMLGYRFLHWRDEWVWVTDRRVMRSFGILTRKVQMIPRNKITDLTITIPGSARTLSWLRFIWTAYGHIFVESPHEEEEVEGEDARISDLKYIPGAQNVSQLIIEWGQ